MAHAGKGVGQAAARLFDWTFRNRQTGRITIGQRPNITLSVFLVTVVLRWVVTDGTGAHTTISWIGEIALGAWAIDELLRGVNPWRRALGAGGCFFAASGIISLLR